MIKSFADKRAEKIFAREPVKRMAIELQRQTRRKLLMLDAATHINELRSPPSNHLEALMGDRKGQYSIRVNNQWRICFRWQASHAYDIELVDYH